MDGGLHAKDLEHRRACVRDVRERVPRVGEVLDDDEDCNILIISICTVRCLKDVLMHNICGCGMS